MCNRLHPIITGTFAGLDIQHGAVKMFADYTHETDDINKP